MEGVESSESGPHPPGVFDFQQDSENSSAAVRKERSLAVGSRIKNSEVGNQVAGFDTHRFGDAQKRMKADPLLAPFDLSNVNRVQAGFFRQLLLAHTGGGAVPANGFPKNFELWRLSRHELSREQKAENANTPNMGVSYAWLLPLGQVECAA